MLRSVAKAVLPESVAMSIAQKMNERADRLRVIDLGGARALREAPEEALRDPRELAVVLAQGGLNDEHLEQFPAHLHPYCGQGLRLWQLPDQFAPYLIEIARRGVRRYLEIGVRHGGSFAATVEYLARVGELEEAVAVDIDAVPSLLPYPVEQPSVRLMQADTMTDAFAAWVGRHPGFDLAFVDGLHSYEGCRKDFETVRPKARMIALHDITNHIEPEVGRVWTDLRREYADEYDFLEFTAQYGLDGAAPNMGIGLAIRH
jgi:Methyltransferase domain